MPEDVGSITQNTVRLHVNSKSHRTPTEDDADPRIHRRNRNTTAQKMAATPPRPPPPPPVPALFPAKGPAFATVSAGDVAGIVRRHPVPCLFGLCMLFFMGVEYTIKMVPFDSLPVDIGFILTRELHGFIAERPNLNSVLAAQNTVSMHAPIVSTHYNIFSYYALLL